MTHEASSRLPRIEEIELPREEYAAKMRPVLLAIASRYGCLAAVTTQGRTLSRGTAAFVACGQDRLLITAAHVVDGLFKLANTLQVFRAVHPEKPSEPHSHSIDSSAVVWCSPDVDVALLRSPRGLAGSPDVRWFDLERGKKNLKFLRQAWNSEQAPYLMLAAGFPNFGHLGGQLSNDMWLELLGMLAVPASIAQLRREPDGKSQIILEITAADPIVPTDADPLASAAYEFVKSNPPAQSVHLGGFSGGPLVMPAENGDCEIIGVITEGSVMEIDGDGANLPLLRATPLDDVEWPGNIVAAPTRSP